MKNIKTKIISLSIMTVAFANISLPVYASTKDIDENITLSQNAKVVIPTSRKPGMPTSRKVSIPTSRKLAMPTPRCI